MSSRHIALLRGINVGGKNKLPMADLAAMFERHGAGAVKTYIQSGNVVFEASSKDAARMPDLISKEIAKRLDLRVPVIVRSAAELAAAIGANPFAAQKGVSPEALHVMFLATAPSPKQAAALDPKRSPPDTFAVVGREIYLCCPNGYGNSKLTNAWFDGKLETVSTCRNWKTALRLLELASAAP